MSQWESGVVSWRNGSVSQESGLGGRFKLASHQFFPWSTREEQLYPPCVGFRFLHVFFWL